MVRKSKVYTDDEQSFTRKKYKQDKQRILRPKIDNLYLDDIKPLTNKQGIMLDKFDDGFNIIASGSAGTGKGFITLFSALKHIIDGNFNKLIIIRTALSCRPQGFIPGDIASKEEIYSAPYKFLINKLFNSGTAYEELIRKRVVEFTTTSYLRGLTFDDCVIFFDEFQNASEEELETVLTRVGENSRIVFAGDIRQSDLFRTREKSGFNWLFKLIKQPSLEKHFCNIEFTFDDCVRSGFVKDVLIALDNV